MNGDFQKVSIAVVVVGLFIFGHKKAAADTAYVANEQSVTISVIDTDTRRITTTIGLGSGPAIPGTPQPNGPFNGEADHHAPLYNGHVDPHGLWLTSDGTILIVTNRISGTVVAIDTLTNKVLGYTPVGREPHLPTVRPGDREAWVTIRGEQQLTVLALNRKDLFNPNRRPTDRMKIKAIIDTMNGPSMVSFTSNGRFAFVTSGKEALVQKILANKRKIVASQTVPAPFSPFGLVSPDDQEFYVVHKMTGQVSILRTRDLSFIVKGLPIGPQANHVFFVGNLAYFTIGGPAPSTEDNDPEGKIVIMNRSTHKIVRELTGIEFTGVPHGIWGASDGRLFVGHQTGNRVTVIDTRDPDDPDDDIVEGPVLGSRSDLEFIKEPIDIVIFPGLPTHFPKDQKKDRPHRKRGRGRY